MGRKVNDSLNSARSVETQPSRPGVPVHIDRLLNPTVRDRRRQKVQQVMQDSGDELDRRRRYITTIVDNHLWKELKSA